MSTKRGRKKKRETLCLRGAPEVALKEVHDATRDRWTASTWTTSNPAVALVGPLLEVLWRGGPFIQQELVDLVPDARLRALSVQTSDSGAYRTTHILSFFEASLPKLCLPGTEQRWKIVFADDYNAHKDDAARRLAWKEKKCVVLLHGGGTTGVAAVSDTRLHQPLSPPVPGAGNATAVRRHGLGPGRLPQTRPARVPQRPCGVLAADRPAHQRFTGWKARLILNALDGTEDHLGSAGMRTYWDELQMALAPSTRRASWRRKADWTGRTSGELDELREGQSDEGSDAEGEPAWRDDVASAEADGAEEEPEPVAPLPLGAAQEAEVGRQASRLRALDAVAEVAQGDARLL